MLRDQKLAEAVASRSREGTPHVVPLYSPLYVFPCVTSARNVTNEMSVTATI